MPNLVEIIQEIVKNTNNSFSLTDILFGTVTNISPLKILLEQKLELSEEFLVLTKNVKDYIVNVTMDWNTETTKLDANHSHNTNGDILVNSTAEVSGSTEDIQVAIKNEVNTDISVEQANINLSHNHAVKGTKTITIHNALKAGDRVMLIQQMGGQKFIVLDKF